jgi:hypothetical protein
MTMNIFQQILETRSMTVIQYAVEEALNKVQGDEQREALSAMLGLNMLDEVYIIAHRQLGQHAEAEVLRRWLDGADARKKAARLRRDSF